MMNKTKAEAAPAQVAQHTPGPWEVRKISHNLYIGQFTPNPHGHDYLLQVCKPFPERRSGAKRGESPSWYGWDARTEANARLIAAAPELLEALKRIADEEILTCSCQWPKDIARAAIAKAEGRQS